MKRKLTPYAPRPGTKNNRNPDPDCAYEARDECGGIEWGDAVSKHAERLEERHAPAEELSLDRDDYGAERDNHYNAGEEWKGLGCRCLMRGKELVCIGIVMKKEK